MSYYVRICPSRHSLNKMLKICNHVALNSHKTFNIKKTMCIKFGEPVTKTEKLLLNRDQL